MKTPQDHGEFKEEIQAIKYPDTMYFFFSQSLLLVTGNSFSEEHNAWPVALNQQWSLRTRVTVHHYLYFLSTTAGRSEALPVMTRAHAGTLNQAGEEVGTGEPASKTGLLHVARLGLLASCDNAGTRLPKANV